MKRSVFLLSLFFCFSAFSATEISANNTIANRDVSCGVISVDRVDATSDELIHILSKKSDELGCHYFSITSFDVTGNSRATAIVYH